MISNSDLVEGLIAQFDNYIASGKCTADNKQRVNNFNEALKLFKVAKNSSPSIDVMFGSILVGLGVVQSHKRKRDTIEDAYDADAEERLRLTKKQNTSPSLPRLTIIIPALIPSPTQLSTTFTHTNTNMTAGPIRTPPARRRSNAPSPPILSPAPCSKIPRRSVSPKAPTVDSSRVASTSITPPTTPQSSSFRIIKQAVHSPKQVPAQVASPPYKTSTHAPGLPSYSNTPPRFRRTLTASPTPVLEHTLRVNDSITLCTMPTIPATSSEMKLPIRSKRKKASRLLPVVQPSRRSTRLLQKSAPR